MEQKVYSQLRQSKIQIYSRLKLKNIFPGEWESIYTGEGIEFADIKPFEPGDDLRDLDILTFVKSGEEEIIERSVGRQMKIYIWADQSGSMQRSQDMFFSIKPDIRDVATGLIIYSACNNYSPTGLCVFDNEIRIFLPAKYGRDYCDKILQTVRNTDYNSNPISADIYNSISFLLKKVYKQSMVFWISDFKDKIFEGDFTEILRPLVRRYDFIPIVIRDPLENNITIDSSVNIPIKDNEGYDRKDIYLTPKLLNELQIISTRHLKNLELNFNKIGIDYIVLDSSSIEECNQTLSNFFKTRHRVRL